MTNASERAVYQFFVEEPLLPVEPATDWNEVARTGVPPRRLPPGPVAAEHAVGIMRSRGWTEVHVDHEGWDDHPQVGSAWWITVTGVPPGGHPGGAIAIGAEICGFDR